MQGWGGVWREGGVGCGGSDAPHGEHFCSSFHYLALSFPGSPLSPRRRNILISVTATHTGPSLLPSSLLLSLPPPRPSLPPSLRPSVCPSVYLNLIPQRVRRQTSRGRGGRGRAEDDIDAGKTGEGDEGERRRQWGGFSSTDTERETQGAAGPDITGK